MKNTHLISLIGFISLFFFGCNYGEKSTLSSYKVEIEVTDLSSLFPKYKDLDYDTQIAIIDSLRPQLTALMQVLAGTDKIELTPELLSNWSESPAVGYFTPAVDTLFSDRQIVSQSISDILSNGKKFNLELPEMEYVTVVWGKTTPIVFNESTMLIALNHYLGEDYPAYESAPTYMRQYKTQENLPYDLCEAIVAHTYPFKGNENMPTMINRMLYEGALVFAKTKLVNDKPDLSLAIGVHPDQLEWLEKNQSNIWRTLAERKLLYDNNPSDIQRLFNPAPSTPLIHPDAPGRVGRYVGYQIVKTYVDKHPETTISDLLNPEFYLNNQSLVDASFSPK